MTNGNNTQGPSFSCDVEKIIKGIKHLPPNELSYYLVLLIASIEENPSCKARTLLLTQIHALVLRLQQFYVEKNPNSVDGVMTELHHLIACSKIKTVPMQFKAMLLSVIGAVAALFVGMIGAFMGAGLGLFSQSNPFKGAYTGCVSGFFIGMIAGGRFPDKLVRSKFELKLIFCLDSLKKVSAELGDRHLHHPPSHVHNPYAQADFDYFQNETKKYILETFYRDTPDKKKAFRDFLKSTQSFQVCSTPSGVLDRKLDNTLGHHSLIRFRINGIVDIPIEFGSRKSSPRWVDQAEPSRQVTGQKLFDMLTLDRILQETHPKNLKFLLTDYKTGDNDCLTYVNKILIGTNQAPTAMSNFSSDMDSWVGRNLVSPCIQGTCATEDGGLSGIAHLYGGSPSAIGLFKRPPKDEEQKVPGWTLEPA